MSKYLEKVKEKEIRHCPVCDKTDCFSYDDGFRRCSDNKESPPYSVLHNEWRCHNCQAVWEEIYELTGIRNIKTDTMTFDSLPVGNKFRFVKNEGDTCLKVDFHHYYCINQKIAYHVSDKDILVKDLGEFNG